MRGATHQAVLAQDSHNLSVFWTKTEATLCNVGAQCSSTIADTLDKLPERTPLTSSRVDEQSVIWPLLLVGSVEEQVVDV
jgi:hypothetical protein